MRIHRLEISAFGPFASTEHIDFDRLSAHGLFLLNGPTGAGKTSVLDAICFALYGSVPGARQDGRGCAATTPRPRPSRGSPASSRPRAALRSLPLSRLGQAQRPGKNGFTVQQANTLLRERVDGEWIEKSGRNDEAGAEIADVLGMNREQFTRVVMLPQGDFAAFLRSKAADRLDLLQSLFGTQRFEAVEQELGRKAQAARTEVASLNGQLELLLAQAEAETAALELDTADAPDRADPDSFLNWLQTQRRHCRGAAPAAALEADRLRAEHDRQGRRSARAARQAAGRSRTRRSEAEAAAPAWPAKPTAGPAPTGRSPRRATAGSGQCRGAEELAAAAMAAAAENVRTAALTDPELAAMRNTTAGSSPGRGPATPRQRRCCRQPPGEALRSALGGLRSLRAVLEERLPDEARLAALGAAAPSFGLRLAQLEDNRTSGAAALLALRNESVPCSPHCARSKNSPPRSSCGRRRPPRPRNCWSWSGATPCRDGPRSRCGTPWRRRAEYQDRRQRWLDLREERLANAAAELASQLQAGAPCPVCGSPEHPVPAPAAASALDVAEAEQGRPARLRGGGGRPRCART